MDKQKQADKLSEKQVEMLSLAAVETAFKIQELIVTEGKKLNLGNEDFMFFAIGAITRARVRVLISVFLSLEREMVDLLEMEDDLFFPLLGQDLKGENLQNNKTSENKTSE